MFKIDVSDTFTWPVKFSIPGDGDVIEGEFTAIWKRPPQSRIEQILNPETRLTQQELINEFLKGWGEDLGDADGNPLKFNATNLAKVLDIGGMRLAIAASFMEAIGNAGPRIKN